MVRAASDRRRVRVGARAMARGSFSRHLREHDIQHHAWEYEGGHAWTAWAPVIERALVAQLAER